MSSVVPAIDARAKDINLGGPGRVAGATLLYIVAGERGFFEREGLRVLHIIFRGTNLMITALLAGALAYATILPFLTGAAGCL